MIKHTESHKTQHVGWLRAAVMGANDGIVSTASLIVGVAAAGASTEIIFMTGVAGLVAGAMSMAAGEYVSVSSQADTEKADIERERVELATDPLHEYEELTAIYIHRGLDKSLAQQVAKQLTDKDALVAHTRDELGISEEFTARPVQAALSSAITFTVGALLPLMVVLLVSSNQLILSVSISALIALAILGALSAMIGGAPVAKAVSRVVFWGALAMGLTALVGRLFGV
ncbi:MULTISPECIES: VIT1/CCC1 transporter family protein [unclassified Methylophaga]|jgi:VIT1/CCC1 family predicted Fe2+/Mn2+ transporter|uniref:VIT1/CCC1 transporter family protein n=1 Tax=unclassified Methylophaga TaxID=2629249 RepID=UPI0025ED9565|nr:MULTISPECIES: VIT family protein [unclassified Methylophaga]|tara:strand:+ start:58775 stop:59461 length:687 start_codon:yes stop_codon:yes gene_type:complete